MVELSRVLIEPISGNIYYSDLPTKIKERVALMYQKKAKELDGKNSKAVTGWLWTV